MGLFVLFVSVLALFPLYSSVFSFDKQERTGAEQKGFCMSRALLPHSLHFYEKQKATRFFLMIDSKHFYLQSKTKLVQQNILICVIKAGPVFT